MNCDNYGLKSDNEFDVGFSNEDYNIVSNYFEPATNSSPDTRISPFSNAFQLSSSSPPPSPSPTSSSTSSGNRTREELSFATTPPPSTYDVPCISYGDHSGDTAISTDLFQGSLISDEPPPCLDSGSPFTTPFDSSPSYEYPFPSQIPQMPPLRPLQTKHQSAGEKRPHPHQPTNKQALTTVTHEQLQYPRLTGQGSKPRPSHPYFQFPSHPSADYSTLQPPPLFNPQNVKPKFLGGNNRHAVGRKWESHNGFPLRINSNINSSCNNSPISSISSSTCDSAVTVGTPQWSDTELDTPNSGGTVVEDEGSSTVNEDAGSSAGSGEGGDKTWDVYHDMIMRCVLQDLQKTCNKLEIPSDPMDWSPSHVRLWLHETMQIQGITDIDLSFFSDKSGRDLMTMKVDEFRLVVPEHAEQLKGCLDIWVTASQHAKNNPQATKSQAPANPQPSRHCNSGMPPKMARRDSFQMNDAFNSSECSRCGCTREACQCLWQQVPKKSDMQMSSGSVFFEEAMSMGGHGSYGASGAGYNGMRRHSDSSGVGAIVGYKSDFYEGCSEVSSSTMHYNIQYPNSPDSGIDDSNSAFDVHKCCYNTSSGADHSFCGISSIGSQLHHTQHIHLWQFIRQLLEDPSKYGECIKWISKPKGIFKIENSTKLARFWGNRKNRPAMNYDKLSRSLRQYYKKGILQKTPRSQRLVYQFCHPFNL